MTDAAIVIRTDNQVYPKVIRTDEDGLLHGLQKIVGGYIETIRPVLLPDPVIMIVNEEGLIRDMHVNHVASLLSGTHIFGDVALMHIGIRDGEPDIVGIPGADVAKLLHRIKKILEMEERTST